MLIDEAQSRRRSDADKPSILQRTVYETGMIERIRMQADRCKAACSVAPLCRAVRDRVDYFQIRNSLFQFSGYVGVAVIPTMFLDDKQAEQIRVRALPRHAGRPNPDLIGTTGCMRSDGMADARVERRRNQRQGIRRKSRTISTACIGCLLRCLNARRAVAAGAFRNHRPR